MSRLPVIVGFGGVSPAGRSSFHHGYKRLVSDSLSSQHMQDTYLNLASMMGLLKFEQGVWLDPQQQVVKPEQAVAELRSQIDAGTLIRKIEPNLFDAGAISFNRTANLHNFEGETLTFELKQRQLPSHIPDNWQVQSLDKSRVKVTVTGELNTFLPDLRSSSVTSAGQLPTGFKPEDLYQSRSHPKGLQMTVVGASDAVQSVGIPWQQIIDKVRPDEISVYASSAMGQLDYHGSGGMLQASHIGKRVTSKNCPLGLAEMPADFVNAYVLGSVGSTAGTIGACATFLYSLRAGMQDIRDGKRKVALIGASEAPVNPEVIEGYRTMGALAEDHELAALDGHNDISKTNNRRACRPFSSNAGFTLAESSQFYMIMDASLAIELGATIYGSVADVFVNADGYKKSISGPGVGNYLTVGKALALSRAIVGEQGIRQGSYIHAHGTGTPQNRVTESHIMSEMAKTFAIEQWPVAAIKSYVGHSLASAAGDQLAACLGTWRYGLIPGIKSIDHLADDVHTDNLSFCLRDTEIDPELMQVSLLNSKGFGGNNATAAILSPTVTEGILRKKIGAKEWKQYQQTNTAVVERANQYDQNCIRGKQETIYKFGQGVLDASDLELSDTSIKVSGFAQAVDLNLENPYAD